jgi:hypothetical protein
MPDPGSVKGNMNDSICKHCQHRVTRVLIPHDCADYGINVDKDLGAAGTSCVVLEHHLCIELDVDLDCDVLECPRFKMVDDIKDKRLIKGDLSS